ncbi:FG-GAP-like repeat-containing protein [Streptomyces sp. NPDC020983]|uniref:FG-GAP-like repeat-containing protein n=1 Tax=Streptomyces sp. NPDC020983 TaxID=3365106 RepID=UPI0037AB89F3
MTPHHRSASGTALAACITLVLGASAVTSAPASATDSTPAAPTEITVVPPVDRVLTADRLVAAGTTGFLHRRQGVDGYQWTDDATGNSHRVPVLDGIPLANVVPAGGDAFAVTDTPGVLKVGTPDRDSLTAYPLPAGFTVVSVAGDGTRALLGSYVNTTVPARSDVEILDLAADGGTTVVPVTGLPDGAYLSNPLLSATTDHAHRGAVRYQDGGPGGASHYALVDLDTGAATTAPVTTVPMKPVLTPTDLEWSSGTVASMLPVSALLDGSASGTPATVTLRTGSTPQTLVPLGDRLLTGPLLADDELTGKAGSLVDYRFSDGTVAVALGTAFGNPLAASDGSVLAVGSKSPTVSVVTRYRLTAEGALNSTTVLTLPPLPSANAGLSMAHGVLRHVESLPPLGAGSQMTVRPTAVAAGSDPYPGAATNLPATAQLCEAGQTCARTIDGNTYGPSYLDTRADGQTILRAGSQATTMPFTGGRLIDASFRYQLVAGPDTLYAVRSSDGATVLSGPVTGAALWNNTLWQAPVDKAVGTVTATDLGAATPAVVRTVATGADCRATEIQVAQHWLYWSCGATGAAGVYDLDSGARIPVPAGQALLGDGYLVTHDAATHQLTMTDFHTGTAAAPLALADVPDSPLADDRGITFAVDRYSDAVAYVTADRNVHVLATGVPASAPTATSTATATATPYSDAVYPRNATPWGQSILLDRPVTSWQVTVTDARTGATGALVTGGPLRQLLRFTWDGKLPDGRMAPSGSYTWRLDVTAQDGTSTAGVLSGTVRVRCGASVYRAYDCDNAQALYTLRPNGTYRYSGHWYRATGDGRLTDSGGSSDWYPGSGPTETNALVPFGDFNGDGYNDLLVRDGSGHLHSYSGDGTSYLGGYTQAQRFQIGSGWNAYNLMLSVGDLNMDGHDDLVARDASGVLWFYAGSGYATFAPRVQIGTGWQNYSRIVAVGDLNADGRGDIVAVDASGAMWRYFGNTHGGFLPRTQTGTGWQAYNALIGIGDLNRDGRNDLVARDASGVLWRYDGRGDGTFRPRVQIGTGWSSLRLY